MMTEALLLTLERLKEGLPGVSPSTGAWHAEACVVCLDSRHHMSGVYLPVKGSFDAKFCIEWQDTVTEQMLKSWADERVATDAGASGLAFLLILELTDYTIIERSRVGTGFDYYLGYKDAELFERAARLEVSGLRQETKNNRISTRRNKKIKQTNRSDSTAMPAYVVIVEFSQPVSHVVKKDE